MPSLLFPTRRRATQWKGRIDMIMIMEKLGVSELLEYLIEQEVVSATVELEALDWKAKDLFEAFNLYEGYDIDEDVKGKVMLLTITLMLLVGVDYGVRAGALHPTISTSLKGKLITEGVSGAKLVEWKGGAVGWEAAMRSAILGFGAGYDENHFHEAICHHIHDGGCLANDVGDRPARAVDALTILGATYDGDSLDVSRAHGHNVLPSAAKGEPSEHLDENVASTLGNLAKQLVLDGALSDALDVCAEWLGVASAETGRMNAFEAYCNLWKRHGHELPPTIDLSRKARGHWKPSMLRGSQTFTRLAQSMTQAGVLPLLEKIDLAEQPQLEGAVLETLFGAADRQNPRKLHTLSLQNCSGLAPGEIPPALISACTLLRTLDLSHCNLTGDLLCCSGPRL